MTNNNDPEEVAKLKKTRRDVSKSVDEVTDNTMSRILTSFSDDKEVPTKQLKREYEAAKNKAERIIELSSRG